MSGDSRYINYITLPWNYSYKYNYITWHYTTLHYTTLTLHYSLYDTTVHNTTVHYTTVHCTTLIKPYHNYNCTATTTALHEVHYTTTTPPLHYTTTTTALHHTTSSSCGWRDHCNHCNHCNHSKKNTPTPFGPSVDSLCHPCITTTHLSSSVLSLKLPPPPCAVLLVYIYIRIYVYIYIYIILLIICHIRHVQVYIHVQFCDNPGVGPVQTQIERTSPSHA